MKRILPKLDEKAAVKTVIFHTLEKTLPKEKLFHRAEDYFFIKMVLIEVLVSAKHVV